MAKEVVSQVTLCIYMHKPTPLREEINKHILSAASFGLIKRWVGIYTSKPKFARSTEEQVEIKALGNLHLLGGYQIFLGGILISTLVFSIEICSKKIRCVRKIIDFVND